MRVAYLINQYPNVSHVFIRREILALERRGIDVARFAIRGWNDDLVHPEDKVERDRTRYILRGGAPALLLSLIRMLLTRPVKFFRALALVWRVSRHAERRFPVHLVYLAEACRLVPWLLASQVEHLHVHFGTNSAEVAMLAHILGGPRWSFTVHGPEEFDKGRLISLADKIRASAFVVAISSYGRSQLYRFIDHQHWSKVQVVHCGLEAEFHTISVPQSTARRLVCVGRICEQKGQSLLVEATRLLTKRGIDFELVFVGDGDMRSDIEALIANYKLQTKVRITGRLSSAKLYDEILAARTMVLPSFAEGLPMVIMEAMALKRPIISTYVAGIPELVIPGEHGWLVPAGDVDALADAMQVCLDESKETLVRMGEAAHARVLARHNVDSQATRLIELFQKAINDFAA